MIPALLTALAVGCPVPRHDPATRRPRSTPAGATVPTEGPRAPPRAPPRALPGAAEIPTALTARVADCADRLGRDAPPELSEALGVLDDDSLVQDACRLSLAVSARAPALCEAVSLGPLRTTCTARAAMASARPDLCPLALGLRGHDPTCVAIAARLPKLCVAANIIDQGRCVALATGNPRACETLDPMLRPACARDVAALAGALPPLPSVPLREGITSALVVTESPDASVPEEYALRTAARGVLLGDDGALWLLDSVGGWPSALATAHDLPLVGVRIGLDGARIGTDLPAEARVLLPQGAMLDTLEPPTSTTARFATLPHGLGSPVRVVVTVTGLVAGARVRVVLDVDTFVRDVTSATGLHGGP